MAELSDRFWICPRCRKSLPEDVLRCRGCGASFQGPAATDPLQVKLQLADHEGPGIGTSFKVSIVDEEP